VISKRRFLSAAVAAGVCAFGMPAPAQDYPAKPVRIIVPFAPGGVDVTARIIADHLTTTLRQPFIVENRPGAGGAVGAKMVVSSEADGYTLMFSTPGPVVVSPLINRNAGYDTLKGFAPVAIVSESQILLVVHPSVPAKTVKELVAHAKANAGKVHFPSPGFGTQPHLIGEMFKSMTGADVVHVPYRGSAPSITDLLAGQMQIYFDNVANVLQHVEAGRLRALAVTGDVRTPQLPHVPTMLESGYGSIAALYWNGLLAPAGTPPAIVARLNAAVNDALGSPEIRAALQKLGSVPKSGTSQEFAGFIAAEVQHWGKVVRDAKMKVE
jgi:tripartite-type tricarboxylate transporter receptor subunit TctC